MIRIWLEGVRGVEGARWPARCSGKRQVAFVARLVWMGIAKRLPETSVVFTMLRVSSESKCSVACVAEKCAFAIHAAQAG
jgi:hypothetical protein